MWIDCDVEVKRRRQAVEKKEEASGRNHIR
jgi:hypothetical protein